jgi:hypothetical protein
MNTEADDFPNALSDDPKTVVMALETGKTEWNRGDLHEAVRWIRRAADAAEAAGNDMRALSLARMAADLKSSLELPATIVPPRDEGAALAPFDDFNDKTIVDSPVALFAQKPLAPVSDPDDTFESESESKPARATNGHAAVVPRLKKRTALRVAVSAISASDGTLRVRVLDESGDAAGGEAEALLVVLDPDAELPHLPGLR